MFPTLDPAGVLQLSMWVAALSGFPIRTRWGVLSCLGLSSTWNLAESVDKTRVQWPKVASTQLFKTFVFTYVCDCSRREGPARQMPFAFASEGTG